MSTSDIRVRLDSDNVDRYTKVADQLGTSRDWLINHILRSIEGIQVTAVVTVKPEMQVRKSGKQLITKRQSTWNAKI